MKFKITASIVKYHEYQCLTLFGLLNYTFPIILSVCKNILCVFQVFSTFYLSANRIFTCTHIHTHTQINTLMYEYFNMINILYKNVESFARISILI